MDRGEGLWCVDIIMCTVVLLEVFEGGNTK